MFLPLYATVTHAPLLVTEFAKFLLVAHVNSKQRPFQANGKWQLETLNPNVGHFGCSNQEEKEKILEERTAPNTNKSTRTAIRCLLEYIAEKHLPALQDTVDADLPKLLENFYIDARTKKENYTMCKH